MNILVALNLNKIYVDSEIRAGVNSMWQMLRWLSSYADVAISNLQIGLIIYITSPLSYIACDM